MSSIGHSPGGTFNYAPFPGSFSYPVPEPTLGSYVPEYIEHFPEALHVPYNAHPAPLLHMLPPYQDYGYPVPMASGIDPQNRVHENGWNFVEEMPRYEVFPPAHPHFGAPTFFHPRTYAYRDVGFPTEQTSYYSENLYPHIPYSEGHGPAEGYPSFIGHPAEPEDPEIYSRPISPFADQTELEAIPGYQIVFKTVPCKFYQLGLGSCKSGADCTFVHTIDDLGKKAYRPINGVKEESSSLSSTQQQASKVSRLGILSRSRLSPTAVAFQPECSSNSSPTPLPCSPANWSLSSTPLQEPLSTLTSASRTIEDFRRDDLGKSRREATEKEALCISTAVSKPLISPPPTPVFSPKTTSGLPLPKSYRNNNWLNFCVRSKSAQPSTPISPSASLSPSSLHASIGESSEPSRSGSSVGISLSSSTLSIKSPATTAPALITPS